MVLNLLFESGLFVIFVKDGIFVWDVMNEEVILLNINFEVEVGSLVVIVGSIGEGKILLLFAVLGEMVIRFGNCIMCGKVVYVL